MARRSRLSGAVARLEAVRRPASPKERTSPKARADSRPIVSQISPGTSLIVADCPPRRVRTGSEEHNCLPPLVLRRARAGNDLGLLLPDPRHGRGIFLRGEWPRQSRLQSFPGPPVFSDVTAYMLTTAGRGQSGLAGSVAPACLTLVLRGSGVSTSPLRAFLSISRSACPTIRPSGSNNTNVG